MSRAWREMPIKERVLCVAMCGALSAIMAWGAVVAAYWLIYGFEHPPH